MKLPFFGRHNDAPVLPSANPGPDELAIMQAGATGPGSETARQLDESAARQARLEQVVATGAAVVQQSVITGEVPMITAEMDRPAESSGEGDLGGDDLPAQDSAEQGSNQTNAAA